jgi:hypothetical protein
MIRVPCLPLGAPSICLASCALRAMEVWWIYVLVRGGASLYLLVSNDTNKFVLFLFENEAMLL